MYADRAKQWPQEFRRISHRASTSCTKSLKIAYAMSFVSNFENFENFEAITLGVCHDLGGGQDDKLSGGAVVGEKRWFQFVKEVGSEVLI